jgi:hypothetical protein
MAEAKIPVDLFNPGQVFACLGFLEATDLLLGNAEGGFDWSDNTQPTFRLHTSSDACPIRTVLQFMSNSKIAELEPVTWQGETLDGSVPTETFPSDVDAHFDFQNKKWTRTRFPFRLSRGKSRANVVDLGNWSDGSSRPLFKLYSGNRSASRIAEDMLYGKRGNATKKCPDGKLEFNGVKQLFEANGEALVVDPFGLTCTLAGRFNFDARCSWTQIDAGFSPDKQDKNIAGVTGSPVVEFLAVWAMENARPDEFKVRQVRYGVWSEMLPPMLCRAAIAASSIGVPVRKFVFKLELSGKNKVVTYSTEESN